MKTTRSNPAQVDVVISLQDDVMSRLSEISQQLTAKGLKQARVMENIGVITGQCQQAALDDMRQLAGVAVIEIVGEVRIAPPDADIQ